MRHPEGVDHAAIPLSDGRHIDADFRVPPGASGVVIFAHGAGSGRESPRNVALASDLRHVGLATLLVGLLTEEESDEDEVTREHRFNIPLMTDRVVRCIDWLQEQDETRDMAVGINGSSTGAAAALKAAAARVQEVRAVVCRGGRVDLARDSFDAVRAPVLFLVGGNDRQVLEWNREAYASLRSLRALEVIAGATHLFDEPGAFARVTEYTASWFVEYLVEEDVRTGPIRGPHRLPRV